MTPIQLAHWINLKQSEMNQTERDKMVGLQYWVGAACTRVNDADADEGSMIGRGWKSYSYVKDEAFAWASKRLDCILKPWSKPRNVENMNQFGQILEKMAEILHQQIRVLANAATAAGPVPALLTMPVKQAPGTLSENQMAKLLALSGLEWD